MNKLLTRLQLAVFGFVARNVGRSAASLLAKLIVAQQAAKSHSPQPKQRAKAHAASNRVIDGEFRRLPDEAQHC